jgi:hypothetical protein
MARSNKISFLVPVWIPAASALGIFQQGSIQVMRMPSVKTQTEAKKPMRVVQIEGAIFAMYIDSTHVNPKVVQADNLPTIYTTSAGTTGNNRQLIHVGSSRAGWNEYEYKLGTTMAERILTALYLFGFMTRAQYQAAQIERRRLAKAEWDTQKAEEAEHELANLVNDYDGPLSLAKAKKLIDGWVKADKQAKAKEAKRAAEDSLQDTCAEADPFVPPAFA